jgi:hypothetical protein
MQPSMGAAGWKLLGLSLQGCCRSLHEGGWWGMHSCWLAVQQAFLSQL